MKTENHIVKICGLTNPSNMEELAAIHPDWIGLIFYPNSPRFISDASLANWFKDTGNQILGKIKKVGVFVDAELNTVLDNCEKYRLDLIQIHGNEDIHYAEKLKNLLVKNNLQHIQLIKAVGVSDSFEFNSLKDFQIFMSYFLFDTKTDKKGGSGLKFSWSKLEEYQGDLPFLLSGGIGPADFQTLNEFFHPQFLGIDLNSKFEISPGLKNTELLKVFLNNYNRYLG